MSIGTKLKDLRIKAGYNKREASEKLEMPYTTYNNYETDAREPGSDTLRKIAKLYGVTIDYLLEYGSDNTPSSTPEPTILTSSESRIVSKYRKLDDIDQIRIEERMDYMLEDEKYEIKEKLA